MRIEIDLDRLDKSGLNISQYALLYCKYHNINYSIISFHLNVEDFEDLETNGFIKITGYVSGDFDLREKSYELFETSPDDRLWSEFFSTYPMKVPDGKGGYRPLRPKSVDAKESQDCKRKYLKIIKGRGDLHQHIIKILNAEMNERKARNTFQYMHQLEVYLNGKKWEKYEFLLDNKDTDNDDLERTEGI